MSNPTITDIAKKCGVSVSTVSRILSRKTGFVVSEATRLKVIDVAEELDYRPNAAARALVKGRTNMVAFLGGEGLGSQLYGQLLKTARNRFGEHGFDMVFAKANCERTLPVDGIVAFNNPVWVDEYVRSGRLGDTALVAFGSAYALPGWDFDSVGISLELAVNDAMQQLINNSRKRIVLMHAGECPPESDLSQTRHIEYCAMIRSAGMEPRCVHIDSSTRPDARKGIADLLTSGFVPDGILCMDDEIAIGALTALRDAGLRVPENVAVIGCDGIEDTLYTTPKISTIVQPLDEACALAADFLRNRIEHDEYPVQRVVLDAKYESRESTLNSVRPEPAEG